MSWCTVCWHPAAEVQLCELWLSIEDARDITAAVNEIDQLLRYLPGAKGYFIPAGSLKPEYVEMLLERMGVIPEDVRVLQLWARLKLCSQHTNRTRRPESGL